MSKKEIIEGNKLIAEFMGFKVMFIKGQTPIVDFNDNTSMPIKDWAKYHSSWDWLIPVIKECRKGSYSTQELCRYADLLANVKFLDIITSFKATISFIKWYNKQKT